MVVVVGSLLFIVDPKILGVVVTVRYEILRYFSTLWYYTTEHLSSLASSVINYNRTSNEASPNSGSTFRQDYYFDTVSVGHPATQQYDNNNGRVKVRDVTVPIIFILRTSTYREFLI
jgi:hypothetical protein